MSFWYIYVHRYGSIYILHWFSRSDRILLLLLLAERKSSLVFLQLLPCLTRLFEFPNRCVVSADPPVHNNNTLDRICITLCTSGEIRLPSLHVLKIKVIHFVNRRAEDKRLTNIPRQRRIIVGDVLHRHGMVG